MPATSTLRTLDFDEADALVSSGACYLDIRDVSSYLEVHIPGSLGVLYEFGPGFNSRARDCIPLEVPLVLLDLRAGNAIHAAASLRGKGFDVAGKLEDGINRWAAAKGSPASTETIGERPDGATILDVNDPGVADLASDVAIPIDQLWARVDEVPGDRVAIAAGFGVRAALAVGMLERAGKEVLFWKTRA